jgi:hypothetical protein
MVFISRLHGTTSLGGPLFGPCWYVNLSTLHLQHQDSCV